MFVDNWRIKYINGCKHLYSTIIPSASVDFHNTQSLKPEPKKGRRWLKVAYFTQTIWKCYGIVFPVNFKNASMPYLSIQNAQLRNKKLKILVENQFQVNYHYSTIDNRRNFLKCANRDCASRNSACPPLNIK